MPPAGNPRAQWSALACVSVLALLLAACEEAPDRPAGFAGGGDQAVGVVLGTVTRESLPLEIEAVGTALANQSVEITSKTTNTVTAIRFEEDQFVRKGEVLVELDSAQVRAELAGAEAALAEARAQYERSRQLEATQALSRAQMDQIEAALKTSTAAVAAARARLSDTVIRAPFDGRTGFRNVSVGSLVSPGTVVTTLDDTSIIRLDFTIPQAYLSVLERGMPITARANGLPGREFEGRISAIGSRIDPVTRSITVRAELPNPDGVLRQGMFMSVALSANPEPVLVVPESAIVPESGETYVFAVVDGKAERRRVVTGRRKPGFVEISHGLDEGETIVVDGTLKVRDGVRVQHTGTEPLT